MPQLHIQKAKLYKCKKLILILNNGGDNATGLIRCTRLFMCVWISYGTRNIRIIFCRNPDCNTDLHGLIRDAYYDPNHRITALTIALSLSKMYIHNKKVSHVFHYSIYSLANVVENSKSCHHKCCCSKTAKMKTQSVQFTVNAYLLISWILTRKDVSRFSAPHLFMPRS